jgi:hypothetical protein
MQQLQQLSSALRQPCLVGNQRQQLGDAVDCSLGKHTVHLQQQRKQQQMQQQQ